MYSFYGIKPTEAVNIYKGSKQQIVRGKKILVYSKCSRNIDFGVLGHVTDRKL